MHMDKSPITPEEKATLKEQIMSAVDACLSDEKYATKADILDKVAEDIEALKDAPEMGGMGEESEAGMKVPESEDEGE